MRKMTLKILVLVLLVSIFTIPVNAETEQDYTEDTQEMLDEQFDSAGANDLYGSVTDDVQEQLQDNNIDGISATAITSFNIGDFFSNLWETVKSNFTAPLRLLLLLVGVLLLCSIFSAMRSSMDETNENAKVLQTVSILAICGVMIVPTINCITASVEAIRSSSDFMMSFIPVFTGVMATSGQPVSAVVYNTALFSTIQVIAKVVANILIPLLGIYMAFSVTSSVGTSIKIDGISESIKKAVTWTLGLLLTIFVGLFTVQNVVSSSADSITTKTAKFLISSFVPVVGSALSEAYTSVQGCLGLIKSSVGAFGIIVCIFTFLPHIITTCLYMLSLNIAAIVADILCVEKVSKVLKAVSGVLSLLIGILLCFSILMIATISIVLIIGG